MISEVVRLYAVWGGGWRACGKLVTACPSPSGRCSKELYVSDQVYERKRDSWCLLVLYRTIRLTASIFVTG